MKITLTGGASANTTSEVNGNYSFTGLAAGSTYTVTPALAGYTYNPAAPSFTLNANTVQNITATPALTPSYSISGTVSYSGIKTGVTYIRVLNCSGCNEVAGTTLSTAPTPGGLLYTVRGLRLGNYVVTAEIDTFGTGAPNDSNPAGSISGVNITTINLTGQNITVTDRTSPLAQTPTGQNVSPANGTAIIQYKAPRDSYGAEIATSYKIYFGTDTNATNGAGSPVTFAAGNQNDVYFMSGLADGANYYFKMSAHNVNGDSAVSSVFGPVLIGATTGLNTVSGTVTSTGITATGPLYIGVVSSTTKNGPVYGQRIASPSTSQAFTISGIPSGAYQIFAVLDMNANGIIGDPGDITNLGQNGPPPITVSGSSSGNIITLTAFSATTFVSTNHQLFGSTNTYSIDVGVTGETKLPVSLTLFSGPNVAVPFDMAANIKGNNNFQPIFNGSVSPTVGDTYQFLVTFSDGSTQVISSTVTAVLNSFAQTLAMNTPVAGSATVPVLNWTAPLSPPAFFTYSVGLNNANGAQERWDYSGNGGGNGLASTTTNVQFDTDGSANPSSSLTPGTTYNWWVTVQDANSNTAQYMTTYLVPGGVGPAAKLAFTVQPADATAGATITPSVQVAIEDASGNIVTSATNQITILFNLSYARHSEFSAN